MTTISVEELPASVLEKIHNLSKGESIAIVDTSGNPEALVTVIQSKQVAGVVTDETVDAWLRDWEDMAKAITRDWKVDKSALEVVIEGKR